MGRLGATFFSGFLFLLTAWCSGLFSDPLVVSPETRFVKHGREAWVVKPGVSRDGRLLIEHAPAAPHIPPRVKSLNHTRTLRAFIGPDRSGIPALYIEQVRPHAFYVLGGVFMLDGESPTLFWSGDRVIGFYAKSPEGQLMRYAADLEEITISEKPADVLAPSSRETLPSGLL
jgi:hypothetical protein